MSRLIAELLGAPEPAFSLALRKLEQVSGRPSADVRLTADVLQKAHSAMRKLGLDPADTTARELYQALMLKVEQDEKRLRKHLGTTEKTSLDELVPTVIKSLDQLQLPRSAWVLKPSVAKRLLQSVPPKTFMKQLGYRSIDSLLKREAIAAVFMGALISEGSSWRERFYTKYRQLSAADCETTDVSVIMLTTKRWQQFFDRHVAFKRRLILPVPELGALVVLPMEATVLPGAALALLLSLVYHINNVRSLSAHVKLQQVKPHFGVRALEIWRGRAKPVAYAAEQPLYWGVVHQHFAHKPVHQYPSSFDPHVQPDDLHHHLPEEVLVAIDPELSFWQAANRCGFSHQGQPVSLHALDAAVNYCNHLDFENRSLSYLQEAMGQELLLRYMREPRLGEDITQQLETQANVPDLAGVIV